MRNYKLYTFAIFIAILAIIFILFTKTGEKAYTDLLAPYPESWLKIKCGMTADEAKKIIDTPYINNEGLKNIDRIYCRKNMVGLYMDIWYDSCERGNERIKRIYLEKDFPMSNTIEKTAYQIENK